MIRGSEPYFSKSNRRGVLLLIVIILLVVFTPRLLMYWRSDEDLTVTREELELVNELRDEKQYREANSFQKKKSRFRKPPSKFDPNAYSAEQWMALGLSPKQANVILKFTSRGVYEMSDFEKIFVIPDELMFLLKDSLVFPQKRNEEHRYSDSKTAKKEFAPVELNAATKEEIMELPGVGPYIADRIIAYRERLGGYLLKEQLMEIKKIDLELFNKIESHVSIDKQKVLRLNVNTASVEEFKKHPYFNWSIANSIVKIRAQKGGSFKSIDELMESALIDRELFEKIKPYLSL